MMTLPAAVLVPQRVLGQIPVALALLALPHWPLLLSLLVPLPPFPPPLVYFLPLGPLPLAFFVAPAAKFLTVNTLALPMTNTIIASTRNGESSLQVDDRATSPARGPLRAAPTLISFQSFKNSKNTSIYTTTAWISVAEAAEESTTTSSSTTSTTAAAVVAPTNATTREKQGVASPNDPAVPAESPNTTAATPDIGRDASSAESAISEFRERLRWLNKVTADATEELDAIAPPPMKSALEGAVKAAQETDIGPAIGVAKRVVGDLQEGFSGLLTAAKDFDAGATTAELKARMEKELESRKEIPPATPTPTAAGATPEAPSSNTK